MTELFFPRSVASWPMGTVRYFAVDYDNGNDDNVGYSDVSMAAAGVVAVKTLEHFTQIFPKFGNDRKAVVAIRSRAGGATYRNQANTADDDLHFLDSIYGYEYLLVRGTDTIASAGAVAFANDAADKICCGARLVPGTNAGGYNPVAPITNNTFDVQLNGGGAPGLAAEPALVGKRVRFDAATTTAALRNATSMIWQNDTDTVVLSTNLPAVPVAADVFYIEEPGVAVNRVLLKSATPNNIANPPSFAVWGLFVAGIRAVNATQPSILCRGAAMVVNFCFCETASTGFSSFQSTGVEDLRLQGSYNDESATPATITTGVGVRSAGGITASFGFNFVGTSSACIAARFQITNYGQFSIGAGSYSAMGALVQGVSGTSPVSNLGGVLVGNAGSATIRRFRSVGVFTEAIVLSRANAAIYGVDTTNCGASPIIRLNGVGLSVSINDVVGSVGNTGDGLQLTLCRGSEILMGTLAANTFTGAAGRDIVGQGGELYVHADYARTNLRDNGGNNIQGTAAIISGVSTLVTNDGNADIEQYKIVRATAPGVVRKAQADTAANAAGIVGVSQSPFTAAGPQVAQAVNGGATWVQFDAGPTAGNIAYLSTANAGNAQDTAPAATGTNQTIRLGRILRVSGTLGLVMWHPESAAGAMFGLFAYKAADESVNSNALQDDDHLVVNLAANSKYYFRFYVPWTTASVTAGINVTLSGTVGVASLKADIKIGQAGLIYAAWSRVTALLSAVAAVLTGPNVVEIEGSIETTTAGTFLLRWAQSVTDAGNVTIVQQNACMSLHKIG